MKIISIQEWELRSFFKVDPELADGEPRPYTDALYVVEQGTVHPTSHLWPPK